MNKAFCALRCRLAAGALVHAVRGADFFQSGLTAFCAQAFCSFVGVGFVEAASDFRVASHAFNGHGSRSRRRAAHPRFGFPLWSGFPATGSAGFFTFSGCHVVDKCLVKKSGAARVALSSFASLLFFVGCCRCIRVLRWLWVGVFHFWCRLGLLFSWGFLTPTEES